MKRSPLQLLGSVVGGAGVLVTLVASFFLAGEDYYPGRFYIGLQALWDNNQYGIKYTFLLTWLTLLDVVVIPLIFVAGAVAFFKRMSAPNATPPPGWDVAQLGRRIKFGLAALVLFPVWLAVGGIVIFAPELLSPIGGFASIFLILLPSLPMLGPALLFEAAIAPRYLEGVIERLRVSQPRKNQTPTVHFDVGAESYSTNPSTAQGLGDGMRVALVSSGFFGSVLRIARL